MILAADAQQVLNDGLAQHNWILIVAGAVALLVPVVLHALGKDVPIVTPLLDGALDLIKKLPQAQPKANPPTPPPEDGRVVPLQDVAKKDQPK